MILSQDNSVMRIIGVEHMEWCGGTFDVKPRDYSSLSFRIKGEVEIESGGKAFFVNTNDVLYIPQGIPYSAKYTDTEMIVIHFITEKRDSLPEVFSFSYDEEIHGSFVSANILWQNKVPGFEFFVKSKLFHILGKLSENETENHAPSWFLKAVSFIHSSYTSPSLSVEEICKNAGISGTALRSFFKEYYKKTPNEYITKLRLEYARNLISCGIGIEESAEKSGFSDSKYFARVVKKHFHCTPRELKNYGK